MKNIDIVCTIGPKTESKEMLSALNKAGMTIARLNFSHGDFAEHQAKVDNIKLVNAEGGTIKILQDLSGPKIRTGNYETETITLEKGNMITIIGGDFVGNSSKISINYPLLATEARVGETIMINDGKLELVIKEINGEEIVCEIILGGTIKSRRGVNLPQTKLSISALTDKDKADISFGLSNNVDYMAFSFVRRGSDVVELREILNTAGSKALIISKIETPEALENIDEIIALSDGIMVARGDLGVEIPREEVPFAQKMMIKKANSAGKCVITATQMMESMIKNATPTRAEVSDVANAVLDGTDGVMTSEETTLGDYPIECITIMKAIVDRARKEV